MYQHGNRHDCATELQLNSTLEHGNLNVEEH